MPSSPSTRKLTGDEQVVLQTLAADELFSPLATAKRFGFYAVVTGVPVLWLLTIIRPLRPARPYVVGAIVLAWIVYGIREYLGSTQQRDYEMNEQEARRQDLAQGLAEVQTFRARECYRVEEFDDEGSSYYLHLEDDSVLFLSGQYLYEPEEKKAFPCTEFDLVRGPRSRMLLNLVTRGSHLGPLKTLKPFRLTDLRDGQGPVDGEILDMKWEDVEAKHA
jgi:hypothetical protein